MARTVLLVLAAFLALVAFASAAGPYATTLQGVLQGRTTSISYEFLNVPYAQPPVGDLRWAPPQNPSAWWPNVRDATAFGTTCPQGSPAVLNQDEDCLYLNVFTPLGSRPGDNRPVVVYFHGGAFVAGAGAAQQFNGSAWAAATGSIIVTVNYRLGILGLLGHPGTIKETNSFGNYLLYDQVRALEWVKYNILAFGGNPWAVTVGGQSSGSIAIGIHLTQWEKTLGLFQNAYMESGAPTVLDPPSTYTNISAGLAVKFNCSGSDAAVLACLRQVPFRDLITAQGSFSYFAKPRPAFDGYYIKEQPLTRLAKGLFLKNINIIAGYHTNESTILNSKNVYPAYNVSDAAYTTYLTNRWGAASIDQVKALYPYPDAYPSRFASYSKADTDNDYICMLKNYLKAYVSNGGSRVFVYHFKREAPFAPPQLGSFHTSELAYNFGNPCMSVTQPYGPVCSGQPTTWPAGSPDEALTSTVRSLWNNLATYGTPGSSWPRFSPSNNWAVLGLDANNAGSVLAPENDSATSGTCPYWTSRVAPYCGDGTCGSGENILNCWVDCL